MQAPPSLAHSTLQHTILLKPWFRSGRSCKAVYLERPHRYAVRAYITELDEEVIAHLGDPGRLHYLLQPGATLLLDGPFPPSKRKTSYTAMMVQTESGVWVSLATTLPNKLFQPMLEQGLLPDLWNGEGDKPEIRAEVKHHNSRFDFQLNWPNENRRLWVELKAASWVVEKQALFPDAPTQRGTKHLRELIALHQQGDSAHVLFVIQRPDAERISPARQIDPNFAQALQDAQRAGLGLSAVCVQPGPNDIRWVREIPLIL